MQTAYYVDDATRLPQACVSNPHFMWDDAQISKRSWNKDRQISVIINYASINFILHLDILYLR